MLNGTDFSGMFYLCDSLENLNGLQNWNVSNGIKFFTMFAYCESLQDLSGLEKWNVANGENFSYMFESCKSLKEISLPDTLAILKLDMFDNCNSKLRIHWKKHFYSYEDLLEYQTIN